MIVRKEWILDCHVKRKRLPAKHYRLSSAAGDTSSSEDDRYDALEATAEKEKARESEQSPVVGVAGQRSSEPEVGMASQKSSEPKVGVAGQRLSEPEVGMAGQRLSEPEVGIAGQRSSEPEVGVAGEENPYDACTDEEEVQSDEGESEMIMLCV